MKLWHSQMIRLKRPGENPGDAVNAEDQHMIIRLTDVPNNYFFQTEEEKVPGHGRLIMSKVPAVMALKIARFYVGPAIKRRKVLVNSKQNPYMQKSK
jgi:hypothetical protein